MWWRRRADGRGADRNPAPRTAGRPGLRAGGQAHNNGRNRSDEAPMVAAAKIQAIYRYPVKGLSPEPLPRAWLAAGETLPGDRAYAIENGPSRFDPALPRYQPKIHYLMLMRNERLATLKTRFDAPSRTLVVARAGHEAVRGDLDTAQGRAAIEALLRGLLPGRAARSRRGSCMRRASASRTWPARWCRSSISHRWRRWQSGWARRSIRCAFAPTSM